MTKENAIILASHGDFAQSALKSLEMIAGQQSNVLALGLYPGKNLVDFYAEVDKASQQLDTSNGLFIITDILGGTPSNAARMFLVKHSKMLVHVFTGLNLPTLLETAFDRKLSSADFAKKLTSASAVAWQEITVTDADEENDEEDL